MLKYTGHPFVDVGVATITAFAEKESPEELTEEDLDQIVSYMERAYTRDPLKSFLTVAFPNSGFTNPAYEKQPEKRQIYARQVLRAYSNDTPVQDIPCVFTGERAVAVPFDVKGELRPGYAFRQHIPLLTGEGVINFHPYGVVGLPVSGKAMLALQALPLGCAKCGGKLLAVHSDNGDITLDFARAFLEVNIKNVQLAQQANQKKLPEFERSHRTLLIETLLGARRMQTGAKQERMPFSVTAYHFTNSGQGVSLDIYYLPMQIIEFLREVKLAKHKDAWSQIVKRAWEIEPAKKSKKGGMATDFKPRRNYLYEDLFQLPENAPFFIRMYFLRWPLRNARAASTDPRPGYSPDRERDLVSWEITAVFLRRILNMDEKRVEQIRIMGDNLAQYVNTRNDRHFFRSFFIARRPDDLRTMLIRANLAHIRNGNPPLFILDPYIEVFEEGEEVARTDWRLARDLVLIRMIEKLYELGWLGNNPDAIPQPAELSTVETEQD